MLRDLQGVFHLESLVSDKKMKRLFLNLPAMGNKVR